MHGGTWRFLKPKSLMEKVAAPNTYQTRCSTYQKKELSNRYRMVAVGRESARGTKVTSIAIPAELPLKKTTKRSTAIARGQRSFAALWQVLHTVVVVGGRSIQPNLRMANFT